MITSDAAFAADDARLHFAAMLDNVAAAGRFLPHTAGQYRAALDRLMATPAPDLAGLVEKLQAADPFDLEQRAAILADARRLAALPAGLEVADARALLGFIDAAEPGTPVPAAVVAFADRLEVALGAG